MPEASNWSRVADPHANLARDQFEAGLNEDAWCGPRSLSKRTYRWLWALKLGTTDVSGCRGRWGGLVANDGKEESGCFWFWRGDQAWVDGIPVMMRVRTAVHQRRHRECDVTVGKTGCKGSGSRCHEVSGGAVDRDMVGQRGQGPISEI